MIYIPDSGYENGAAAAAAAAGLAAQRHIPLWPFAHGRSHAAATAAIAPNAAADAADATNADAAAASRLQH